MKDVINIGSRRELLWDDHIVDTERSDTKFKLHRPVRRDCVITYTGSCYGCVLQDGDIYRMYSGFLYSESRDGIHWERPYLTNSDGTPGDPFIPISPTDGFRVFIDNNPNCKPDERYKAVGSRGYPEGLQVFACSDGFHFKPIGHLPIRVMNPGSPFDSINTLFYDENTGTYKVYARDYSSPSNPEEGTWSRAISMTESKELFASQGAKWPRGKYLRYDTPNDWQMYTNSIMPYYRAPHVYVGFPARYALRFQWTENYDELCGSEARIKRSGPDRTNRAGLSCDDSLFMCSRDGLNWTRYPEAFLRPGPEHPTGWVYGGSYFQNGMVETKSAHPGCDNEISMYVGEGRWFDEPGKIWRYTIRLDGFASQSSVYPESVLYTKPFIFEGKDLFINFSTSAYGSMTFTIKDEDGNSISSCPTFGDSTDRRVRFHGDLSAFAGKPVTMTVRMFDCDFYSFIFR